MVRNYKRSKKIWGRNLGKTNTKDINYLDRYYSINRRSTQLLRRIILFLETLNDLTVMSKTKIIYLYDKEWFLQRNYRISGSTFYRVVSWNEQSTTVLKSLNL